MLHVFVVKKEEERKNAGPKPTRNHQQRLENIVKQTTVETRVRCTKNLLSRQCVLYVPTVKVQKAKSSLFLKHLKTTCLTKVLYNTEADQTKTQIIIK